MIVTVRSLKCISITVQVKKEIIAKKWEWHSCFWHRQVVQYGKIDDMFNSKYYTSEAETDCIYLH